MKTNVAQRMICVLLCHLLAATGVFADDPPKYYLYQDVGWRITAVTNAYMWVDESGNKGVAGQTPDPTGDYYTGKYSLATHNNTQGDVVPFACNSLHIGEVGVCGPVLNVYTSVSSVFEVLGQGLFLHKGIMALNWRPVTVAGNITVDSPPSDPFKVYDLYCNTVLNIPAAMHSRSDACLHFYGNSGVGSNGSRVFAVKITGDCSDYRGEMVFGRDADDLGRTTHFYPPEGGIAGKVTVKATGTLVLDSADIVVGGVSFENGATILKEGGCLVVTNSFAASGIVNISMPKVKVPNVEYPKFAIIHAPAGSGMSTGNFSVLDVDLDNNKAVSLSVERNAEGGETLYATYLRNSVYVSPDGDDGNSGVDADNPFRTLAHAVSVLTNGVIYALPGTYEDGLCEEGDTNTQSRVFVPDGVYLKSTGGYAVTTIKGSPADDGGDNGPGSTRCVRLDGNAVLEGFTLTGGHAYSANPEAYSNSAGGGVRAGQGNVILNCFIHGNTAQRGGGGYGGNYVYTTFGTNTALRGDWSGPDLFGQGTNPRCFDCMFLSHSNGYVHVYQRCRLYNCTFTTEKYGGVQYDCKAYNCLIRSRSHVTCANNTQYYNCVLAMEPNTLEEGVFLDCVVTNLADAIDAEGHPTAGSPVIDVGNRDAYLQGWDETGLSRTFLKGDFRCGQRIYNGRIDVGAVEYDWRGDYTGIVAKRRMEVVQASEDVEAVGQEMLRLVDGTKLQIDWDCTNGGEGLRMACAAAVTGTGTLTVKMDGTVIATVTEGNASVTWKSTDESHVLEFSYSGDGEAQVGSFENKNGLRVRIR